VGRRRSSYCGRLPPRRFSRRRACSSCADGFGSSLAFSFHVASRLRPRSLPPRPSFAPSRPDRASPPVEYALLAARRQFLVCGLSSRCASRSSYSLSRSRTSRTPSSLIPSRAQAAPASISHERPTLPYLPYDVGARYIVPSFSSRCGLRPVVVVSPSPVAYRCP